MKDRKHLKHEVLEVMEGGLRGNAAARAFAWVVIVLILASIGMYAIEVRMEEHTWFHPLYIVVESITVGVFTLEAILGFWTADVRFPDSEHPRLRFLREPMTIIEILAILPFYLSLVFRDPVYEGMLEILELLKLLHLLKVGELIYKKVRSK